MTVFRLLSLGTHARRWIAAAAAWSVLAATPLIAYCQESEPPADATPADAPPVEAPPTDAEPDEPAQAAPTSERSHELLGVDASFFSDFVDGEPLEPAERDKLLLLMNRLHRLPRGTAELASQSPLGLGPVVDAPDDYRGDLIIVRGFVRRVQRESVPPEEQERLGFATYYRCEVTAIQASLVVYARRIPAGWKLDEPIKQECDAIAVFLKELPPQVDARDSEPDAADDAPPQPRHDKSPLLFVADRLGWYPDKLLGHLNMDVSLLEDVEDRQPLKEREAFYRLLIATRRAVGDRLEKASAELLDQERARLERLLDDEELDPKARAAANRALDRAEAGASDIVPLFNEPAKQRGKLFTLSGEALRAIRIRVDDPDIQKRFRIDHYYELELVTPDSQNNPIAVCATELPPGMPLGESIHENVRVTGFFFKSWAFDTHGSSTEEAGEPKRRQLAPLLVAKTVRWIPASAIVPPQSIQLAAGLVAIIVVLAIAMWYVGRSDRKAHARAATSPGSLPPQIALDDLDTSGDK